jgi:pimeloyl-ACP methyl ester carboxylesterase
MSIDIKSCNTFRLTEEQINKLDNVKYLFCEKDKLARYDKDNVILKNLKIDKDIFILDETGHFPFFEDPDKLEGLLKNILQN